MRKEQAKPEPKRSQAVERKPYTSPRLQDYGPVARLTQGTSTRATDSTPGALLKRRT
jgi:hypothetical protein